MKTIEIPLFYFIRTRLGGPKNFLSFFLSEIFPLFFVLSYLLEVPLFLLFVSYVGFISIYELGYLFNDRLDHVTEVDTMKFLILRLFLFSTCAIVIGFLEAQATCITYVLSTAFVFLSFILHNYHHRIPLPYFRLFTFSFLRLFKYMPIILPYIGFSESMKIQGIYFLCTGVPSLVVYAIRKYGDIRLENDIKKHTALIQTYTFIILSVFGLIRYWEGDILTFSLIFIYGLIFAAMTLKRVLK